MMSTSRKLTVAILSLLLALPASGVLAAEPAKEAAGEQKKAAAEKKSSPIRAKVNGVAITAEDVDRGMKALLQQNNVDLSTASPELRQKAEEAALNQLISAEALYAEGKKLDIKDLEKQVEERVNQGRSRFSSKEDFEKALAANNLTEKDLAELTRKDIVIAALINKEVMAKVSVSDDQVKKFYKDNKENFKKPETVRASHILIAVDQAASSEEKKKAKEKAEAILKKLKGGADFAELAKADSSCPSAQQGGDLGEFGKGQMVPAFEEAAFALKPGELSGVVETQFGYHIIKLTEKNPGGDIPLEEVKDRIAEYLKQSEGQKKLISFVEEIKGKSKIEMLDAPKKEEKKAEPAKEEKKGEAADKKEEKKK